MARKILVLGHSGTGKTTALRNLDPRSTFIINPTGKALPFRGWKANFTEFTTQNQDGNMLSTYDPQRITNAITLIGTNPKLAHIKTLILDDAQYILTHSFMQKSKEKGFDKYTTIAREMYDVLTAGDALRDDLTIVYLWHSEVENTSDGTITTTKTIGKLLSEKIVIPGLFTIVLETVVSKGKDGTGYFFKTNTVNGESVCKTPMGMFEELYIPNDLVGVLKTIDDYDNVAIN